MAQPTVVFENLPPIPQSDAANGLLLAANTTDSNGVLYTGRIGFTDAIESQGMLGLRLATLVIPSAQVLTLYSVPVTFGITVPTGYFSRPISVDFHMLYNSTPYATNTSIGVRAVGASDELMKGTNYLSATSDTFCPLAVQGGAPNAEMLIASQDFEVFAKTGDPTAGDSDITLYMTYVLIPT